METRFSVKVGDAASLFGSPGIGDFPITGVAIVWTFDARFESYWVELSEPTIYC